MRLVADYEVPFGCSGQLGLQVVRVRRHVEPNNEPVALDERVAGDRGLDLIARQRVKMQTEFLGKLILPLLDEISRSDNQAAVEIAADHEQARHDGFTGARIVREQEAQRLTRQHLAVNDGQGSIAYGIPGSGCPAMATDRQLIRGRLPYLDHSGTTG
jgi:capsular polysaccharide biosynthesis protein